MSFQPLSSRQVINYSALSAIGSAANTTLDVILGDINSIFAAATSAPTPSTLMKRDANGNVQANSFIPNEATTVMTGGTTTLTVSSPYFEQFTGTGATGQTVVLPDATTMMRGQEFFITNRSSGTGVLTVNANGGGLIQTAVADTQTIVTLMDNSTSAGVWDSAYSVSVAGTVTSVSFAGDGTIFESTPVQTVTTTGTFTPVLIAQAENTFLAGPYTGAVSGDPTFRYLQNSDFIPPSIQNLTTVGSGTYYTSYALIVPYPGLASDVNANSVYSSGGHNFKVSTFQSAGSTQVTMIPLTSNAPAGPFSFVSGGGPASITYSTFRTPLYLEIRMVAGGGGGGGSGTGGGSNGGFGGNTSFSSFLGVNGGSPGILGNNGTGGDGGDGGTIGTFTSPAANFGSFNGSSGTGAGSIGGANPAGGCGGSSPYGGAGGGGGGINSVGYSAYAGSGSGGGGGGGPSSGHDVTGGGGGGSGAYINATVYYPTTSYTYSIGNGGTAGTAGITGNAGGAGGSGSIIIKEYYQ